MFNNFKLPDQVKKEQEEWEKMGFSTVKDLSDGEFITPSSDDPDLSGDDLGDQGSTQINKPSTSTDVYKELFKQLVEKSGGTIKEDEELTIEDSTQLIDLLEERVISAKAKQMIDKQFESAAPQVKMFLGVKDYFDDDVEALKYVNTISTLESFSAEDMENADLQKDIYADYLMTVKNHTKEEADEAIKSAEALSELEEKAARARKQLISTYTDNLDVIKGNKNKKIETAKKAQEKEINDILSRIDKMTEIKGLPVTEEFKKAVKKNLTTPAGKVADKPVNQFALKQGQHKAEVTKAIEVLNTLGLFNIDSDGNWSPDFTKISTIVNKPVKNKLDEMLKSNPSTGTLDVVQGGLMEVMKKAGYNK
jgi:hypothetical protein